MPKHLASIVIRTLNESVHLPDLLQSIASQSLDDNLSLEIVVVDSGSTDGTLAIVERFGCRIVKIDKSIFSFGRSLNWGCEAANGDILVFISGHCVPVSPSWLQLLCQPLVGGSASYAYGRQVGDDDSYFSERRIFAQYYPDTSAIPQAGLFCNNAEAPPECAALKQEGDDCTSEEQCDIGLDCNLLDANPECVAGLPVDVEICNGVQGSADPTYPSAP